MITGNSLFLLLWITATLVLPVVFRKRGIHEAQMVSTGFGILGTFLGIVYGLYHFDVSNIEQAVPQLLDGLRFAFITSIAGMAWSLCMGMFPETFRFPKPEQVTTGEPYLLSEILKEMRALREDMAGQGTDSMVTQLQKLRSDQNDNHKELKKIAEQAEIDRQKSLEMHSAVRSNQEKLVTTFEKFTEEMAKQNVEALIKAVQQVMDDFTRVINDQLENTFSELKDAARELTTWQRDHKEDMAETAKVLTSAKSAITTAEKSLQNIAIHAETFDETATKLQQSVATLSKGMTSFNKLAESMEGSGETLRKELEIMSKDTVNDIHQHSVGASKQVQALSEVSLRRMQETAEKALEAFEELHTDTLQKFGGHLASIAGKMTKDFEKVQQALSLTANREEI